MITTEQREQWAVAAETWKFEKRIMLYGTRKDKCACFMGIGMMALGCERMSGVEGLADHGLFCNTDDWKAVTGIDPLGFYALSFDARYHNAPSWADALPPRIRTHVLKHGSMHNVNDHSDLSLAEMAAIVRVAQFIPLRAR